MERRKFIKATGAVGVGAAIAGCTGGPSGDGGGNGTVEDGGNDDWDITGEVGEDSTDQLQFQDVDLYRLVGDDDSDIFGNEGAGAGVRGQLKNTADQAYESVEVEVTLYDDSDDVLGEWLDNTEEEDLQYLNPGASWGFNVVFEDADVGQATRYTVSAEGDRQDGGSDGTGAQNGTDGNGTNSTQNGSGMGDSGTQTRS